MREDIERRDWFDTPPQFGKSDGSFVLVEKAYVLDKSTRHCYTLNDKNNVVLDNARGWTFIVGDRPIEVDEDTWVRVLRLVADDPGSMVMAAWSDGMWSVKL